MIILKKNFQFVFIAEPGPPGAPECVKRDRDGIEIKWNPPRNDGGNPVKGYIVERREKSAKKREWSKLTPGEFHKVSFSFFLIKSPHEASRGKISL